MTGPSAPDPAARRKPPWALVPRPNPAARLRLICFHSAGGGPSMYRQWPASFPPDIEVILAQLPGREARIKERPIETYSAAIDDLFSALAPYLDGRYALFGHSMGSLLAFGLAEQAQARSLPLPERLFVSACRPPHRQEPKSDLAFGSDERLREELVTQGGTAPAVLRQPELIDLILPVLRADYRIVQSAPCGSLTPLDCPLIALCGDEDTDAASVLLEWSRWSTGEFRSEVFPGGHFYLAGPSGHEVIKTVLAGLGRRPDRT